MIEQKLNCNAPLLQEHQTCQYAAIGHIEAAGLAGGNDMLMQRHCGRRWLIWNVEACLGFCIATSWQGSVDDGIQKGSVNDINLAIIQYAIEGCTILYGCVGACNSLQHRQSCSSVQIHPLDYGWLIDTTMLIVINMTPTRTMPVCKLIECRWNTGAHLWHYTMSHCRLGLATG